ncbi:magnesium transporter CorA family protein [bacterium]|nr:magnesium transporter CorA family protein [bacterium]
MPRQIIKAKNLTWIDVKKPKRSDIQWLKEHFRLHPLVLKELLPPLDYPKIENFGNYLFIVLFYPFFDRKSFRTIPFELDIIVSKNYIITNHYKDIVPLKAIFDKCNLYEDIREEYTDEGPAELLYRIINEIFLACFPKLSHIKQNIDRIERQIFQKKYKETVAQISLVKRDIIGFQRIIEPQKLVLTNLAEEASNLFNKKFLPYFHNLISLYDQIHSILNTRHKTLDALDSTNQSLLTTKTNEIIKLLTIFSVIVFPLTLLAAIFGMNTTYLPFVGRPSDFWIICSIMMAGVVVMLVFFKVKKWI